MNIIEKLEPVPDYDFTDLDVDCNVMSFDPHVVREIKRQRDEMLEALIDSVIISKEFAVSEIPWRHFIKIIEKATGTKWEEIKELV